MYLKRLEIQGFKSFPEKTILELGLGITAIVGPNGSGKSNIAEAVRWVLGETSARSLRGLRMEDVIFTGSEARKAVGMAEVSLILDNADHSLPLEFNEVAITRRVHRSGEGEFFINRIPCRLRDLQDLFHDTGVGQGAITLLGQGQVEEILNARPEERRVFLEEVAGIVRYRQRKKEALRRLEETARSLERLGDLQAEMKEQLSTLAGEAEVAERYLALRARLEEVELVAAAGELRRLYRGKETLDYKRAELAAALERVDERIASLNGEAQAAREALERDGQRFTEAQADLYRLEGEAERLKGLLGLNVERRRRVVEEGSRARLEAGEAARRLDNFQEESRLAEEKMALLRDSLEENGRKVLETQAAMQEAEKLKSSLEAGYAESRISLQALNSEQEEVNKRLERLERDLASLREKGEQLKAACRKEAAELRQAKNLLEQAAGQARGLEEARDDLARQREALGKRHLERQREAERKRHLVDQERAALQEASSRLQALTEMQRQLEGFQRGVQSLLQARLEGHPATRELVGVVAELIRVPERYEAALEVALGGALQDLVMHSEAGAKEAIRYLKEKGAGRATFLPLNTIRPRELAFAARKCLGRPGVLGTAAELVDWEKASAPVGRHLLGAILVAVDLEVALAAAREGDFAVKVVTLGGEVVHPGGSLTGGSPSRGRGSLLGRKRELEGLGQKVREAEARMAAARLQEEGVAADLLYLARTLREMEDKLREQEIQAAACQREEERALEACRRHEQRLAWLEAEQAELAKEEETILAELAQGSTALEDARRLQAELAERIIKEERELEAARGQCRELAEGLTTLRVERASLGQEERGLKEALERGRLEIAALEAAIRSRQETAEKAGGEQERLEGEGRELASRLDGLEKRRQEANLSLAGWPEARSGYQEKLKGLEALLREAEGEADSLRTRLHGEDIKLARQEAETAAAEERLREKFGLEGPEALERCKGKAEQGTYTEIRRLEKEMAALGPVNTGSIEQYARLKERHEFYDSQKRDLLEAREALHGVLHNIDAEMLVRFREVFSKVNEALGEAFHNLFGGGSARLELTDGDSPLEAGLEIVARPPGKKPQNISLLSGGERALTAISLLFAVLKVRPSPFCILDETDATLDEANVDRFACYLRELSARTQVIIISHRQGTMEVAGCLYGATMEVAGVSRLVSMALETGSKAG